MDDRKRTLAAVTVIIAFLALVAIVVGAVVTGKKTLSPVPEEGAIKIIFTTPTPTPTIEPTPATSASPSPTSKSTTRPTATPTP